MPAYTLGLTYVDDYGREGSKQYKSQSLADMTAALAAAGTLVDSLAVISGVDVLRYTVGQEVAYTDTVTAGANKDAGVTLRVRKTDTRRDVLKVPAPLGGIFITGTGDVDITDTGVLAYVDNFTSSGDWLFSDGELATELLSGELDV